jgi:mRNA interferase MazF
VKRGDFYRVYKPGGARKLYRTCMLVSRQALTDSKFATVICAPVYNRGEGLATQVAIAPERRARTCELDHV